MNAHIQEVVNDVDRMVESGILSGAAIRQLRAKLAAIPEVQCDCPACCHEELDERNNPVPIDKLTCSCGGACCGHCRKACANPKCTNTVCGDCRMNNECEECNDRFCHACKLDEGLCEPCRKGMSPRERREWSKSHAPAYAYEGD